MDPRVAVLLSVYNGERFLKEQIESVLRQSVRDFTFYIRDDGSTDGSIDIIRAYAKKDSRIEFIEDENGLGYPACFHALTNRDLTEDYILFCDQDDIWKEEKIAYMLERMQGHEEEIAAYFAAYEICDAQGKIVGHSGETRTKFTLANTLFQVCGLEFTMAINNRALRFLQQHMPQTCKARGTWMSPMYAAFGTVLYDARPVALYRRHTEAVTADNMSFFGLWKWRIAHFFGSGFASYKEMIRDFTHVFYDACGPEEQKILRIFAAERGVTARFRKVFYPKRLRTRWADELGLRAAFLLGKL